MADLTEAADAGLKRFLALTAGHAKPKTVPAPAAPPAQTNGHARADVAQMISFQALVAEVERAHESIYAPQYGIGKKRSQ